MRKALNQLRSLPLQTFRTAAGLLMKKYYETV